MTVRVLSDAEMSELHATLIEHGYEAARLETAVGSAVPPRRAGLVQFMHATRRGDALSLLARTFLAALPSPVEAASSHWSPRLRELLTASQLVEEREGMVMPRALLVPVRGHLFASDSPRLLETDEATDFVPPAHTHAASYLLDLMFRRPVDTALDLGTGCGVHALAAAEFARHVVASDLNERAVRYAQFNASLNGLAQVECVAGDLYAAVADREFDLIVGNPPFVPAPGREYTYRDAGMVLDGMTKRVIREGAVRLKPGGLLEVLCEWVEIEGESWQQRLAGWMSGLGCDVWVLRSPPQDPQTYAALRLTEIDTGRPATERSDAYGAWLEHFASHRVKAIHPGVIVLRRRQGRNWMQIQPILREVRSSAGEAILENLRACDFLAARPRADSLLDQVLTPSPDLAIEQSHRRSAQGWEVAGIRAWLNGALPFDVELDPASAMLLREFDGRSTVAECLQRFATSIGEDFPEVRRRCLPVLRFFIERGLLRPPAAGAAGGARL